MTCKNKKDRKIKQTNLSDIIIPKYQPLVNDKVHMHKIIDSGRAGTKSSFIAILVIYMIVAIPDTAVVVMRKHHNKLRKTVFKEVIRAIKRLGLNKSKFEIKMSPMQITYRKNGNVVYFTGSDSIDDTKGMIDEERKIRLVVLDELTEFFDKGEGEDELTNIEATFVRGNDEFFEMYYLFNPPKSANAPIMRWVKRMEKREDCIHVHSDYTDVPESWLGKKLIQAAEAMKNANEVLYNWLWLGLCVGTPETVYYMFKESMISKNDDFTKLIHVGISIDYGQLNATTYQAFGMNTEKLEVQGIDEYYHSGRDSGFQKTPSEYARDFKNFYEHIENMINSNRNGLSRKKIEAVFIDPSARGLAEEIRRIMPGIRIVPANNKVALGIERTQKMFSFFKLFINYRQEHLIDEMDIYKYNTDLLEKGREEVIKTNDHCCDAMRYYIMGFWKYFKMLLPVTERGDK